jgi:hypothetical protein
MSTNQPNSSNPRNVQPFPKAKQPDDGQPPHHNGGETAIAPSGDEHHPKKSESWISWKVVAPLVGGAMFYFAYLVGVTFQQTYLGRFGINAGAFPQDRSDYLVLAALALLKDLNIILGAIFKSKALLIVVGSLFITGALSFVLVEAATKLGKRHRGREPLSSRAKLLAWYLLVIPIGGAYLIFALPTSFATVMVLPVELGSAAAVAITQDDMADYAKGCSAHSHGKHCFNLVESGNVVATGFVIQQSKDNVALWDNGKVKLLPMEKRSLESGDTFVGNSTK